MDKKIFCEKIKALRAKFNFTQKEIAEKLQINLNTYKHFETHSEDTMPAYSVLISISKLFDVSIDYLLGLTENPQKH